MKKILLCAVLALSLNFSTSLFAQAQGGAQMQQVMREYLKDSLHLADPMVDSVLAVRMQFMPQVREVFADQSLTTADRQSKMADIRKLIEARYKEIGLTEDQVKMIRERDERMRQMRNKPN